MAKNTTTTNSGSNHNMIANGTKIVGNITTDADVRFDGEIDGDITCQNKVIIGTTGVLTGNLTCINADIMGHIKGKIVVSELLSVKNTATIESDIHTKIISIEPGATFSGTCSMI
ncbi:MAG: polymer-forming cytoskeletal protein [Prevotellaceae bacterium]|jgi:cytoskeletal protein CcmA (bactofilin family)|nr:polymer-forming cytoskeletal protein [Prevotellaceae bacterium]